jgi:hypothetical protein
MLPALMRMPGGTTATMSSMVGQWASQTGG